MARKIITYSPTGLAGIEDVLSPLTKDGAKINLYHHVSMSQTLLAVIAAGLGTFFLTSILKIKKKK